MTSTCRMMLPVVKQALWRLPGEDGRVMLAPLGLALAYGGARVDVEQGSMSRPGGAANNLFVD
ncbi:MULTISPECIES: hypothetical protein [Acetobacter]|uniref:hypothetical protein n=1 Tax=Acetobacter TaxID=434 RepID=UPI0020A288B9|nr:hypothetical protein [Acetobacter lambici]MCP1242274.1 hypothetical protein [Acetobacter lambici]